MKFKRSYATAVVLASFAIAIPLPAHASVPQDRSVSTVKMWNGCKSYTWSTGTPDKCFYQDLQAFVLRPYGYTGAIDGIMGNGSWKAMQRLLNAGGFKAGTVDGIPGYQTKTALQRMLRAHGYKGAIDGVLGTGTYRAWAGYVLGAQN